MGINFEDVKNNWFLKFGGLLFAVFLFILSLLVLSMNSFNGCATGIKLFVSVTIALLGFILWYVSLNHVPLKSNKVNLIFSFVLENKEDENLFKNDLIRELKNFIDNSKLDANLIFFNPYLVEKFKNKETIDKFLNDYLEKYKIIFLKGILKKRNDKYYIQMQVGWNHEVISIHESYRYGAEVGSYFNERRVEIEKQVEEFKITSKKIYLGVEFISVIILEISKKHKEALDKLIIFYNKRGLLSGFINISDIYNHILFNVLQLLTEKYYLYLNYLNGNNAKFILEVDAGLNKYLHFAQNSPLSFYRDAFYNLKSITVFLLTRDTKKTRNILKKVNGIRENKLVSEAFLYAYDNNVYECEKRYKKIKKETCSASVLFETENFIYKILKEEPDKYSLYFCLGYINLFLKGDEKLGKDNFDKFLKFSKNDKLNLRIKSWIETLE